MSCKHLKTMVKIPNLLGIIFKLKNDVLISLISSLKTMIDFLKSNTISFSNGNTGYIDINGLNENRIELHQ